MIRISLVSTASEFSPTRSPPSPPWLLLHDDPYLHVLSPNETNLYTFVSADPTRPSPPPLKRLLCYPATQTNSVMGVKGAQDPRLSRLPTPFWSAVPR